MIAYTLGYAEDYDRALAEAAATGKISIKSVGGSVWRTPVEALDRALAVSGPQFAVYTIEIPGSWDESTASVEGQTWSRLIVGAEIIGRALEEIERGLAEGSRFSLAAGSEGQTSADAGEGHTINALRRRRLIADGAEPVWCLHCYKIRLSPLGCKVQALAKVSTRVGGGKSKRGPRLR